MSHVQIRRPNPQEDPQASDQEGDEYTDYYDDDGDDEDSHWYYDPKVIRPKDTFWLRDCRVLGSHYLDGAVISGPGYYEDYGIMTCGPGDDPISHEFDYSMMTCYQDITPFHWDCYRLLSRRITGLDDTDRMNRDVIDKVMGELVDREGESTLNLEYADGVIGCSFHPGEQAWPSYSGEEFFAISPLPTPEFSSYLLTELGRAFTMPHIDSSMGTKVKSDPFTGLPEEVIQQVLSHVSQEDLARFFQASWTVHNRFHHNNGFWKLCVRERMPWFFELQEFLQSENAKSIESAKGLFLWAQKVTTPHHGIKGPFMKIANRRRIWSACSQLAERYFDEISKREKA